MNIRITPKYENYYIMEYPNNIEPTIRYTKCSDLKDNDFKLFKEKEKLKENIHKKRVENEKIFEIEREKIKISRCNKGLIEYLLIPNIYDSPVMLYNKLNINIEKDKPEFVIQGKEIKDNKLKFKILKTNIFSHEIYDKLIDKKYCDIQKETYNYRLKLLYKLYEHLEIGGIYFTAVMNFCDIQEIEYIYLLSLLFEKIILKGTIHITCIGYIGNERIKKDELKKIIKHNKFCIEPKPLLKGLMNHLNVSVREENRQIKLLLKGEYTKYEYEIFIDAIKNYIDMGIDNEFIPDIINNYKLILILKKNEDIKNSLLNNIVIKKMKEQRKNEIKMIKEIVKKIDNHQINYILELGMGFGIYTKEILEILNKSKSYKKKLIVLDSDEKKIWDNNGIKYLEENNIDKKNLKLITTDESDALQKINQEYAGAFNFILVQKYGTFEKMMLELFFIITLLRFNGYLMFEKSILPHTNKLIEYIDNNLLFLEKIPNIYGIHLYKKINDDTRNPSKNFLNF